MILFPEGGRTSNGELRTFKKLPFHMAKLAKVEIVPIAMKGMFEINNKNSLNVASGTIKLTFGKPIGRDLVESMNESSLKDAVPQFNGGCTSEVISPKGLLLTNHHCGFDEIQSHSTVEHDYLTDGFWAYKMEDELPNKGVGIVKLNRIESDFKEEIQMSVVGKVGDNLEMKVKFLLKVFLFQT